MAGTMNWMKKIGPWAFIIGVVIALLAAILLPANDVVPIILACLGVLVGLLNINDKEIPNFLIAAIALMLTLSSLEMVFGIIFGNIYDLNVQGSVQGTEAVGEASLPPQIMETPFSVFLGYILTFVAPAAAVVALKQIWLLAKD